MIADIDDAADLDRRIDRLASAFFRLSPAESRIAVACYRLLCDGKPVSQTDIARHAGLASSDVLDTLDRWPGVYLDGDDHVIGFWGLSFKPVSGHRMTIAGRELYAWCAWDTLFIPIVLDEPCTVRSRCKATGERLEFVAAPNGVVDVEQSPAHLSFLIPEDAGFQSDVVGNFCHYVHFFRNPAAANAWVALHPPCFSLSLKDAVVAAQRKIGFEYGSRIAAT